MHKSGNHKYKIMVHQNTLRPLSNLNLGGRINIIRTVKIESFTS